MSGTRRNGRGMRPDGGNKRSPKKVNVVPTDVIESMVVVSNGPVMKENSKVVPLSVEAEEYSLRAVPLRPVPTGEGPDSRGNRVPPREVLKGVFGRCCGIDHGRDWGGVPDRLCRGGSPGRPCQD